MQLVVLFFSNFLHRWFHGDISRENAEKLLRPFRNGNFLVRESQNYKGDYTLCVRCVREESHQPTNSVCARIV